ncbi:uncharacterized protein FIBRA_06949 [Fibroporia radiculosa]|uniref:C-factor n=1 Tax=Fibroporia radiculosa TaxID=599839 RepID=J4H4C6_9APHY|nr:uncharacterized protein FIBRA_06949 [Fibroporia radiculosa]CCM04759.1 predicted protein [Fibroporia radiculosa]
MTSVTWLITGSSRGLGFELVRQLLPSPENFIIATCRNPDKAAALQELKDNAGGKLHLVALDTNSESSIRNSFEAVKAILNDRGVDYLYNNAGLDVADEAFSFQYADLLQILQTNVAGPALIAEVYLPLVEKSRRKTIINVSSGLGSIGQDRGPSLASYCISKSALNMLTYKQAKAKPNITSIALSPGWVQTDMGGPDAPLLPQESVASALKVVKSLTLKDSGKFLSYDGSELPW